MRKERNFHFFQVSQMSQIQHNDVFEQKLFLIVIYLNVLFHCCRKNTSTLILNDCCKAEKNVLRKLKVDLFCCYCQMFQY